jgi:hypothetical protein
MATVTKKRRPGNRLLSAGNQHLNLICELLEIAGEAAAAYLRAHPAEGGPTPACVCPACTLDSNPESVRPDLAAIRWFTRSAAGMIGGIIMPAHIDGVVEEAVDRGTTHGDILRELARWADAIDQKYREEAAEGADAPEVVGG